MRQSKPFAVGITGGVGAGKSEVLRYLEESVSCRVFLADEIAKGLEAPGQPCYDKLIGLFGEELLADKRKFAAFIFSDTAARKQVNDVVHPAVKAYLLARIDEEREKKRAGAPDAVDYVFVEAALLLENGFDRLLDEVWYIYASEETRRKRLKASRGYEDARIDGIFAGQLSEEEFRARCQRSIVNDGDFEATKESLREIIWQTQR